MFAPVERLIAFRYLRSRRKDRFVSIIAGFSFLGIALGVATLIIVMSVMNGFRAELMQRVLGITGHMSVFAYGKPLEDYEQLTERVRAVDGVVYAAPIVEGQAMLTVQGGASGALVRGVRADDLRARDLIADNIVAGSLADFGIESGAILGHRLANRLGLRVGDSLRMIAPQGSAGPFGTVPRTKGFRVVGLFDVGMYEYDNSFVFVPLEEARVFFQLGDGVSKIELMITDPGRTGPMTQQLTSELGPDIGVSDWRRAHGSLVGALEVERNVMFLILTLIILVAAFNIVSSMIMLVKDKGRDIAVLRAMGATRGMIMRVFFLTGASVGVAGTIGGFALGLWFSLNVEGIRRTLESLLGTELFAAEIYFLSRLPAKVDSFEVAMVVTMALVLSVLATLYPSWRAGRLSPAEALRYE